MMKKVKLLGLFVLISIMGLNLVACGGGSGTDTPDENDTTTEAQPSDDEAQEEFVPSIEDATVLTFWTFVDTHAEYFYEAQNKWNEQNPDRLVEIDASVMPFGSMHENLLMSLQSGTGAPDLADIEVGMSGVYLETPHVPFLPQNEVLAPYLDDLIYSRVEMYEADGNYFGVCYHVGSVMMFYNKSLFEQADLDWNDIVTWDDFVEMGQLMVERTDAYMLPVEGANLFTWEAMIAQQGQDFTIDGRPNVDTPEAIKAMSLLQDLIYEYEIARLMPGLEMDSEEFYAEITTDNFAALIAPAWYMGRYINLAPDQAGNIAVAPLPVFEEGNNRSASAGGTMTAVTNQVDPEHADLALEFVAFAKASYEMSALQWNLLGFDPIRSDVLLSDSIRVPSAGLDYFGEETFDVLYDIADETSGVRFNAPNAFTVRDHLIVNVLPNIIIERSQDAESALIEAQQLLEGLID